MTTQLRSTARPLIAGLAAAVLAFGSAFGADTTKPDARSGYEQDKANCMSGRTNQSQADCLKEARNSNADARRGVLENKGADYQQNQRQRCDALTGDEQSACIARMNGQGTTDGSARSGGILRELTTVQPAAKP